MHFFLRPAVKRCADSLRSDLIGATRTFTTSKTTESSSSKRTSGPTTKASPHRRAKVGFSTTYVHPLSQLVLQHLQRYYHPWITSNALHHLVLHADGTFALGNTKNGILVRTYFDTNDLGHWLGVTLVVGNHPQMTRYLLQDNTGRSQRYPLRKARASAPERVKESVRQMVKAIDGMKNI